MTKLEQIFDEIARQIKWTGETVLSADEPAVLPPKIGWSTESKHWSISLPQFARDLDAMANAERREIIRKHVGTSNGRRIIAMAFPGQRQNGEPPVFECPRCDSRTWIPGYSADSHSKEECEERLTSGIMES